MGKKQRIQISPSQKKRLLKKNAYACCVCKKRGIGLNFHHLDEDPSNNNDDNIAVLCVKEHDYHHRPKAYPSVEHLDLSTDEIRENKNSWESFVEEASKTDPAVLALVTAYGTQENINGFKIVFQWVNGEIEFERKYSFLDGSLDVLTDRLFEEVNWIGKNIKIVMINEPAPLEYCTNCNGEVLSRTLDENIATKLTAVDWDKKSFCTVYINSERASLAYTIFYKGDVIYQGSIHKCGDDLHFMDNKHDERYPLFKYKVRTQVAKFLGYKLKIWKTSLIIYGTGNSDKPDIIDRFILPSLWEEHRYKNNSKTKKK